MLEIKCISYNKVNMNRQALLQPDDLKWAVSSSGQLECLGRSSHGIRKVV